MKSMQNKASCLKGEHIFFSCIPDSFIWKAKLRHLRAILLFGKIIIQNLIRVAHTGIPMFHQCRVLSFQLLTLINYFRYILINSCYLEVQKGLTFHLMIFENYTQSCLTVCDPMDCSPPVSSVYGILHARLLEWIAISFSRGSS